ncbi:MAG: ABC transporter substrate-binding protein [Spirochaetota bacterium]
MKKYSLSFLSRIVLIAAAVILVYAHESFRGIFPVQDAQGAIVSDETIKNRNVPFTFSIAAPDAGSVLSILAANGGKKQNPESWYAKNGISADITQEEDAAERLRGFTSGRYNIIALSPVHFSAAYPSLKMLSPVAFLQCGSPSGAVSIIGRPGMTGIPSLKNKRIACTEKSPEHFLILYLLSAHGIHPKEINWIFTLTGDDALRMYESQKADAALYNSACVRKKIPSQSKILFSTQQAPLFDRYVLVAKESDLAVHSDLFAKLVQGHFEARSSMIDMKIEDARAGASAYGVSLEEGIHPALIIPSFNDNLGFFRMTAARSWDYASVWIAARRFFEIPDDYPGQIVAATQNLLILESMDASAYKKKQPASPPPSSSGKSSQLLFSSHLKFKENTTQLTFESQAFLNELTVRAALFPDARIAVRGGAAPAEISSAWLSGAREAAARDIVVRVCGAGSSRVFISPEAAPAAAEATISFFGKD